MASSSFALQTRKVAALFVLCLPLPTARLYAAGHKPTWLWVRDEYTELGIPGASVDVGPEVRGGPMELAPETKATAHYETGSAGRVLVYDLPKQFSCRVTLRGRVLALKSISEEGPNPYRDAVMGNRSEDVSQTIIYVDKDNVGTQVAERDEWTSSSSPTRFRGYIQDRDARRLIPDVEIEAVRSGITTTSDADGLFTMEIPASYRKGKSPSLATETLVFSKRGYQTLEYRQLILQPDLNPLEILLQTGTGSLVRRNRSLSNRGNQFEDEFFECKGTACQIRDGYAGEIASLEIVPSTFEWGWISYKTGAKAIVKARNVRTVEILYFPTGTGITSSSTEGEMTKVQSSPREDTWELELSDNILSTSFWAQGIDIKGKTVTSIDLGNVGFDGRKEP